jgi:hypothetical protein
MKFFKYFTYSEIKDICNKLDKKNCYFRHPQSDFINILGQETVGKLVETGCLKDSPHITYPGTNINWHGDYNEPCYEYGKWFRKLYNFITVPFWIWLKCYVFHFWWFRCKWQSFRIWCGHHYDWQDYNNIYSLDEI